MNLYCDIIRQRFAASFWLAAEVRPFFTQNDDAPARVYLLTANQPSGFPFMYDVNSGKAGVIAVATLCNPGGAPLTLTTPLTLDNIKNGFSGVLLLNTAEIVTFLAGYAERPAFLSVEVTNAAGNKITSFLGEVTLRSAATAASTSTLPPGIVRVTAITGYTGGGSTNLDGIVTAGKALGTLFWVKINGAESHWELVAGSTPSDPDSGIILTTDGGQLVRTIGL